MGMEIHDLKKNTIVQTRMTKGPGKKSLHIRRVQIVFKMFVQWH